MPLRRNNLLASEVGASREEGGLHVVEVAGIYGDVDLNLSITASDRG